MARWLAANLPGSGVLRASPYGFPVLLTAHVVLVACFAGLVVMMDLRLVGAGHRAAAPAAMHRQLFPWFLAAFALTAATGVAMVWADPLRYYGKTLFWWKVVLMGLAGLNAGTLHWRARQAGFEWNGRSARWAGAWSLLLWAGVVALGRLTAYEWFTTEY
jgi:hypothetical protein